MPRRRPFSPKGSWEVGIARAPQCYAHMRRGRVRVHQESASTAFSTCRSTWRRSRGPTSRSKQRTSWQGEGFTQAQGAWPCWLLHHSPLKLRETPLPKSLIFQRKSGSLAAPASPLPQSQACCRCPSNTVFNLSTHALGCAAEWRCCQWQQLSELHQEPNTPQPAVGVMAPIESCHSCCRIHCHRHPWHNRLLPRFTSPLSVARQTLGDGLTVGVAACRRASLNSIGYSWPCLAFRLGQLGSLFGSYHMQRSFRWWARRLLCKDPAERLDAAAALAHPWIAGSGSQSEAPLGRPALERLRQFACASKLRRLLLRLVVRQLPGGDVGGLEALFHELDVDGDGCAITETNRMQFVLLGMQNRTSVSYLAARGCAPVQPSLSAREAVCSVCGEVTTPSKNNLILQDGRGCWSAPSECGAMAVLASTDG
jgi:hypothetical protein